MRADPLILGIESATSRVGCAIGGPAGVIASASSARGRRHAESLAPQIEFVAGQAGVTLSDIGAIAVDVGPGLYTGLRVGVTTAMTLAHMLHVPVVAITSLDLIAHAVGPVASRIDVAIDARRGEVFHAAYEAHDGGVTRVSEPAVEAPADLRAAVAAKGRSTVLAGDGAAAHPAHLELIPGVRHVAQTHPSAEVLVEMARPRLAAGDTTASELLRPLYLRRPDAVAKWEAASR